MYETVPKRPNTMLKQPKIPYSYSAVGLDEEFPFTVSELYEQGDKAITHLHFHNAPELGICLDGSGVFIVEDKILPFKKGDSIFIGREERHLAQSSAGTVSKWHWLYFDLERIPYPAFMNAELADLSPFKGPAFMNVISREAQPKLCSQVAELVNTWKGKGPFLEERIIAQLTLFAAEMHRAFPKQKRQASQDALPESDALHRLRKALELIARKHRSGLNMAELAKACGLSPTHFRRLFHQSFGKSPKQYLSQLRIAMSMTELACSRRPVSEIAFSCGFETLSCFNRQFKAKTGVSPRQWRGGRRKP
jgi:AraC-like DNA-binding protein